MRLGDLQPGQVATVWLRTGKPAIGMCIWNFRQQQVQVNRNSWAWTDLDIGILLRSSMRLATSAGSAVFQTDPTVLLDEFGNVVRERDLEWELFR